MQCNYIRPIQIWSVLWVVRPQIECSRWISVHCWGTNAIQVVCSSNYYIRSSSHTILEILTFSNKTTRHKKRESGETLRTENLRLLFSGLQNLWVRHLWKPSSDFGNTGFIACLVKPVHPHWFKSHSRQSNKRSERNRNRQKAQQKWSKLSLRPSPFSRTTFMFLG